MFQLTESVVARITLYTV